jgi:cobalt-zinc-cadmium efflux system protein
MTTHGHGHSHSHVPGAEDHRGRLAVVLAITATILVLEVIGAAVTGSLALLADAGHMLTDAAGLVVALGAAWLMRRPATSRRTWGYVRAEVLAATAQSAVLLAVGVFVLVEGVRRLLEPPAVSSGPMLVFGAVGLLGNLVSMAVLLRGRRASLNTRAAFLEVANDALGSVAVVVAAVVIATTGWTRADAVVSVLIAALILPRTLLLLRETTDVLLESTPKGLDLDAVREHILSLPHVNGVHDLHASQLGTGLPVLTAHVVVEEDCFRHGDLPAMLDRLQSCVADSFGVVVHHSTFQLEPVGHEGHESAAHS